MLAKVANLTVDFLKSRDTFMRIIHVEDIKFSGRLWMMCPTLSITNT